ncbi:hypothetical protein A2U01_0066260 [Trifolium medium]|uniref:Uncharacterized protein n=1 Tax=Trifolium medium TaxID=97028 RepID=A0A392S812_9FABA|nr:hypothetical protein [Trifolium medium]
MKRQTRHWNRERFCARERAQAGGGAGWRFRATAKVAVVTTAVEVRW